MDSSRDWGPEFSQPLTGGLARPALPADMCHAGDVAKTQAPEVVRRPGESVKLKFLHHEL